jgi:hypothetical protein
MKGVMNGKPRYIRPYFCFRKRVYAEQAKEDAGADAGGKPPGTGRGEDVEALQWATTLVFWSGMGKPS